MTLYETVVDPSARNSSHALILELVGEGRTVLDVGCATGYLAEALSAQGCTVSGIEVDPEAAEQARPKLADLVVGDLESVRLEDAFPGRKFDAIVLGDVLEHLSDPVGVLRSASVLLAEGGRIVLSIPNVAHGSVRLALLQGRWRYTGTGLLDETHVRFYTADSVAQLVHDGGLRIEEMWATTADPLAVEVDVADEGLPTTVVDWVRHQPRALDYQYVVVAHPARDEDEAPTRPEIRRAVPDESVRSVDRHTKAAADAAEITHRQLTVRDHIIGLEAEQARAESDVERLRAEVERLEGEISRLHGELGRADQDRTRIKSSTTWKIGRLATSPVRAAKRAAK